MSYPRFFPHFLLWLGGLLLITAIVWLSWPQSLPRINLTLTDLPGNLDGGLSQESAQGTVPQVNTEALDTQADLAFVRQDLLYVAEAESGSVRALTDSGRALAPAWSYDGEWLAFISVTEPENGRGPLWLVRRDGTAAHEVQGLPETLWDWSFSWSPTSKHLVVALHGHGLWLVPTVGKPELLDAAPRIYRAAWSHDGRYLAYNLSNGDPETWDGSQDDLLCVMSLQQRQRFDLVQTDGAGIRILGWWPDGQGILYWEVPAHGGSVATDGVLIQSVPLSYFEAAGQPTLTAAAAQPPGTLLKRADTDSPQPVELIATLCRPDWTQFTSDGKLLAVEGGGRIAWANKQLALVNPTNGQSERLAGPIGRVMLDPNISNDTGRIAFVAAPDLGDAWGLTEEEYYDWLAQRTLWVRTETGDLQELTHAGANIVGPTWSADGQQIRYFADDALWMVAADNRSPAQKIIDLGPCASNGIYGAIDYNAYFAWYQR